MKSTRPSEFFTSAPDAKKARAIVKHTGNMLDLPDEIWLEILNYLNKKQLRDISQANSFFHRLVDKHGLFQKASWPTPDYEKMLLKKSSSIVFNKLAFEEALSQLCLIELDNGDVIAGTEKGNLYVLELGSDQWRLYGQHQRTTALKALRNAQIHNVTLLPSGILASCGDDGVRLWDRKERRLLQLLSLPKKGWGAKQDGVHELKNGDLISSNKQNIFYLWRKTSSTTEPYQYAGELFRTQHDNITKPYLWFAKENIIVGGGTHSFSRWTINNKTHKIDTQHIALAAIKQRIAKTMQTLRRDDNFIATQLKDDEIEQFNTAADHPDQVVFELNWATPTALLTKGCVIATFNYFQFILNVFDENIAPLYLGDVINMALIETINEDLFISRTTPQGCQLLAMFDPATNSFGCKKTLEIDLPNSVILLKNGHALIAPPVGSSYIFDIYSSRRLHDLNLEPTHPALLEATWIIRLNNGDLLGGYYIEENNIHLYMIWDYQTGRLKNHFQHNGQIVELKNGDLMTHYRGKSDNEHVNVMRFGIKD